MTGARFTFQREGGSEEGTCTGTLVFLSKATDGAVSQEAAPLGIEPPTLLCPLEHWRVEMKPPICSYLVLGLRVAAGGREGGREGSASTLSRRSAMIPG